MQENTKCDIVKQLSTLDCSGLFNIETILEGDINVHNFIEVGLTKLIAIATDKKLTFFYINSQNERQCRNLEWNFDKHSLKTACFHPTGTWLVVISENAYVHIIPFLPQFNQDDSFDRRWSLQETTSIPIDYNCLDISTCAWWLTKESEHYIVIAQKDGTILFFSLEQHRVVAETCIPDTIINMRVCFDDSLDQIILLIYSPDNQYWYLLLEYRSNRYNWLRPPQSAQTPEAKGEKRDFMTYIRQFSADKINMLMQKKNVTTPDSEHIVVSPSYSLQPLPYTIKEFEEATVNEISGSTSATNEWIMNPQNADGRHFMSALHVSEAAFILQSIDEQTPSQILLPKVKNDEKLVQALWSSRILFLLKSGSLEIHSVKFSVKQPETKAQPDSTLLWSVKVTGEARAAWLMTPRTALSSSLGWREPTFLCDLQLPRFSLESCLVVTDKAVYIIGTKMDACEWTVGRVVGGGGGVGAERAAAALGAPVRSLLSAAADLLLSRGKSTPAQYLYSLSQGDPDNWTARLAIFGRWQELASTEEGQKPMAQASNTSLTLRILAKILNFVAYDKHEIIECHNLTTAKLEELSSACAGLGAWDLLPKFGLVCGLPEAKLTALRSRKELCRGALFSLLQDPYVVPLLLEKHNTFILDYVDEHCEEFDTRILKLLSIWMCPLQEQLRAVLRDLHLERKNTYTTNLERLISTFMRLINLIDLREPRRSIKHDVQPTNVTFESLSQPHSLRSVSAGLQHWAVAGGGAAKVVLAGITANTDVVGAVLDVSCGRHHTLFLTENGVYSVGDNRFGQLGVGKAWTSCTGEAARLGGRLLLVAWHRQKETGDVRVTQVAAGHYHSAALDSQGQLYTWGWGVHGQLGLGTVMDIMRPQHVTLLGDRKVLSVGCGACHTCVLVCGGEVWAFGTSAFGQLGTGQRNKFSEPIRVSLPEPITMLAVGYFHNLAVTQSGSLYCWGSSPQSLRSRAAVARAAPRPPATPPTPSTAPTPTTDIHLKPYKVDTQNVHGSIVQIAAGWHQSFILAAHQQVYSWGFNFDGQLGSGDRKEVLIPTLVTLEQHPAHTHQENKAAPAHGERSNHEKERKSHDRDRRSHERDKRSHEREIRSHERERRSQERDRRSQEKDGGFRKKGQIACGGDFTVYLDPDGRVFITGNTHQLENKPGDKGARVITMKTSRRVIKIPANRNLHKYSFQLYSQLNTMLVPCPDIHSSDSICLPRNPLKRLKDFERIDLTEELILSLRNWIDEKIFHENLNMRAKLASFNSEFRDCLKYQLLSLKTKRNKHVKTYFKHTDPIQKQHEIIVKASKEVKLNVALDVFKARMKEIGLSMLNEQSFPTCDYAFSYAKLQCMCDETKYLTCKDNVIDNTEFTETEVESKQNLANKASEIIYESLMIFPNDVSAWEDYIKISIQYFIENDLPIDRIEETLKKVTETRVENICSSLVFSEKCAAYTELFSPNFYLVSCKRLMNSWK